MIPVLLSLALAQTPDRTFGLLKDDRKLVVHVPYTPAQRQQVANNINNLFQIYYHREQKIQLYGKEYGKEYDPVVRVQKVASQAANMTDADFHYSLAETFVSMRDFHLNYNMPAPHSCFAAVQAVTFDVVEERGLFGFGEHKNKVVVRSFSTQPEVLALSPTVSQIAIGDELVSVDGLSFDQLVQKVKFQTGGANESGALRSVLRQMSVVNGRYYRMPGKDEAVYVMKSYKTGSQYTVTLPWIARRRTTCYDTAKKFIDSGMVANNFVEYKPKQKGISKVNEELQIFKETFKKPNKDFVLKDTVDPIIKWGIYKPESKNMGVLFMEGFTPLEGDDYKVTLLIRSLLLNELKNTNSLVIDIRENGGGSGLMSDLIPQLFTPNPGATTSRAINHPTNKALFKASGATDFLEAIEKAKEGDRYTPWVPGTPISQLQRYGMAYTKPVGLFTSGQCFSACDYFSANMQDANGAIIFGEDKFTGAGGADVIEYTAYLRKYVPEIFGEMPFVDVLARDANDARVSWRAGRRFGKNDGAMIEDFGIKSDKIIRPSVKDFLNETQSQFDFIADELERNAIVSGKKWTQLQVLNDLEFDASLGQSIELPMEIQGFKKVEVVFQNTTVEVVDVNVLQIAQLQTRKLQFVPKVNEAVVGKIQVRGYNLANQLTFITFRQVRLLPRKEDYLVLTGPTDLIATKGKAVFENNAGENSWNRVGTTLTIGNGSVYADNIDSTISYFINTQSPLKLKIKAKYDTEQDYDYFIVGYKTDKVIELAKVSGAGELDTTFDIPVTSEVFVKFTSDGAVTSKGVVIETLVLSQ